MIQIHKATSDKILGLGENIYTVQDTETQQDLAYLANSDNRWVIHLSRPIAVSLLSSLNKKVESFLANRNEYI